MDGLLARSSAFFAEAEQAIAKKNLPAAKAVCGEENDHLASLIVLCSTLLAADEHERPARGERATQAAEARVLVRSAVSESLPRITADAASLTQAILNLLASAIDQTPEDRHAVTARLGAFKTSMLQDVEMGKALELDALVTVVKELGALTGVPTPFTDALLGLSRLHGRVRSLY